MKKTTSATILKIPFLFLSFLFVFLFNSCTPKTSRTAQSIAVFIPGIIADSPTYEKVSNGVTQAVTEYNASKPADQSVKLTVIEAGTNQAEWGQKLTALAATGSYSVIISSNPSLPELCDPISAQFPDQKFILLDAYDNNNNSIASVSYDQRTQAFLSGYISGLVSKSP